MTRSKAAFGLAAGALVVTLTQGVSFAASGAAPRLTAPVMATKGDVDPARTYTSPSIAVDPENTNNVVMGYVEARTRRCGMFRSTDGGQHWVKLDASPSTPTFPFCFVISGNVDMVPLAFGRNHTLYYALSGYDDGDGGVSNGNVSVLVAKSTDLGDHWTTVVARSARGKVAPDTETSRPVSDLAVDTHSGPEDIIYVAFRSEYRTTTAPNLQPRLPNVVVSTDGGKTFSAPVNVAAPAWADAATRAAALKTSTTLPGAPTTTTPPAGSRAAQPDQPVNFGGSNPSLTVDDKGRVYVAWVTHSSNISPAPVPAIWLSTSSDKGKTYTASAITPFQQGLSTFGTQRIRWSPQGGTQGSLHLVYEGTTRPEVASETDATYQRSTDGGKTWTKPVSLNDEGADALKAQNSPNLSIAPNGRVDVVWWDARNDPGIRSHDVYYASSTDNGASWSKNVRITDKVVDRRIGIWGNGFDVSVPPGVASTNKTAIIGWDDTRNGTVTVPTQDLLTSDVQFARLGSGPSKVAKGMLAGVAGLLAVGLILAAATAVAKR